MSLQSSVEKGGFDFLRFLRALGPVFMRLLRLRHQIDLILQTVSSSSPGKKSMCCLILETIFAFFFFFRLLFFSFALKSD